MPPTLRAALALVLLVAAGCDTVELPAFGNPNDTQLPDEPLVLPPDAISTVSTMGTSVTLRWTPSERPGTGFFVFRTASDCSPPEPCQPTLLGEVGPDERTFTVDGLIGTRPLRLAVATRGEQGGRSAIGLSPLLVYSEETLVTADAGTRGVVSLDGTAVYTEVNPGPDPGDATGVRAHDLTAGTTVNLSAYNVVVGAVGARRALLARADDANDDRWDVAVADLAAVEPKGTLASPGGPPTGLVVSTDGRRVAGTFLRGSGERGVALWDLDAGGALRALRVVSGLDAFDRVLGVTGDVVLLYRLQERIDAIDLVTGETVWTRDGIVSRVAYDEATSRVFAYRNNNRFVVIDGETGAVGTPIPASTAVGRPSVLGGRYGLLTGGSASGQFYVVDVETDETVRVVEDGRQFVTGRIVDETLVLLSLVGNGSIRRIPLFGRWQPAG